MLTQSGGHPAGKLFTMFTRRRERDIKGETWWRSRASRSGSRSCCWAGCRSCPRWRSACGAGSSWGTRLAGDGRDSPRCLWCCGDRRRSGWCPLVSACPSEWRCPSPDPGTSRCSSCTAGGKKKHIYFCVDLWRTARGAAWAGWGVSGKWAACLMRLDSVLLKVQLFCGILAVLLEVEPWWFLSLPGPAEQVGVTCAAASLKWQWQGVKLFRCAAHGKPRVTRNLRFVMLSGWVVFFRFHFFNSHYTLYNPISYECI